MRVLMKLTAMGLCFAGTAMANILADVPADVPANIPADVSASIERQHTAIPAQRLETALQSLAKERDLQVICRTEVVGDLRTQGASGELTTDQALVQLLTGTGLTYRYLDAKTITILPPNAPQRPTSGGERISQEGAGDDSAARPNDPGLKLASTRAGAGAHQNRDEGDAAAAGTKKTDSIAEIVVTAQKREEGLQEVPVPVTAIDAGRLASSNQLRLEDYYTRIPGVNLAADSYRNSGGKMVIRGIVGGGNPTVGIVVDDVPYGSSSGLFGAGGYVPDIDPSELARIEVLRGPQGTLYGASSIGGLLNYVTIDPSTEALKGRMEAGFSTVENGDELGYTLRGSVNVPLGETWALRASGFTRRDAGYIDNVQSREQGVNGSDVSGGRLSALWKPSDDFSLKLSALLQRSDRHGAARIQPLLGNLKQTGLPNTGRYEGDADVYTATVRAKLGRAELTAISGYSINEFSGVFDLTTLYGGATAFVFGGDPSTVTHEFSRTKKFTQEVRLALPLSDALEWRIGGFYTDEDSRFSQSPSEANPTTGAATRLGVLSTPITTFEEYAAFTDLTWKITDQFDLQLGGRYSRNRQAYRNTLIGPFVTAFFGAPSPLVNPPAHTEDNSFTYLLTPRWRLSQDLMMYARLASGYRTGGPNFLAQFFGAPIAFEPDETRNYEVGFKGTVLDNALYFDASVYYIQWQDVQVNAFNGRTAFLTNAGEARSQGVELSLESKPWQGMTAALSLGWNDAQLAQDLPATSPVFGLAGDRLQGRRFTGSLSLEQTFPVGANSTGFVGGSLSRVSSLTGEFAASAVSPRRVTPGYTQADLRAGVTYGSWQLTVYANNITDERGILSDWAYYPPNTAFYYIQPRTLGLSLAKDF